LLEVLGKRLDKKLLILRVKVDSQITTNFIKTCIFNTSACTTESTAGDNTKFEKLNSGVGAARYQDSRPCQTVE